MTPEEFRHHAHMVVDWMADYMSSVVDYPVRSQVKPGDIEAQLSESPPEYGEPFETIFKDFCSIVMPGITHWQHPRFFAYFPANSSPPSVLGEMIISTLAAQCMLWQTSPAATEMETRVLQWVAQILGLPSDFCGVIQDSASTATLCAVLVAREKATGWQVDEVGPTAGPPVVFYCSAQSHSSVEKAIRIAGIGRKWLRKIPLDENWAMRPDLLQAAITADRAAGHIPAGVIACVGSTSTGAVDPLSSIAKICGKESLYLHVDAAWAGSALVCPETRGMIEGIELVDSFVFNPHKWLLTNFDCSAHYVRDPASLVRTLTILPAYLKSKETGSVIDYRDWGVPLGRRFRSLKLWFVLRSYGVSGLQKMIRDHISWTKELATWIDEASDFVLVDGPRLALLNFRYRPATITDPVLIDTMNEHLLEMINDDGRTYLTPNRLAGRFSIRFAIGQANTTKDHVRQAWGVICEIARGLTIDHR